ncbi:MAG TPA: biotin carboxylase N-terminal domain-containing protein [Bacteroidales bacterium]|nr:biotin carboxylase N-terminal domain-containing protein [Bacteroidales bacterium]
MMEFHKVLIANRGEIAMRIIRSVKKLGLSSVAVYAENDKHAAHVRAADQAFSLGDGPLSDTYLSIDKLLHIASESGCQAIHPGYGFLSERPALAMACEAAGIAFIGPGAPAIQLMGNKVEARRFVQELGVPVIEGRTGSPEELMAAARELSFPLLIKAAAGGGGKGMRIVRDSAELPPALEATAREATAYFGDGTVYAERFLENPRHIEVQVFGDQHGNAVHLFERECSVQRRYQKIIEECPSPSVNPELRERITEAALTITRAIGYSNAGTIEFLLEGEKDFFFLEMNTRIQVEHPVTEMVTGTDLVEEQIRVAAGQPLSFRQEDLRIRGHALESRIYAEDPDQGFLPSPGQMTLCRLPEGEGIRVESGISHSLQVSADYDPMIAKVVVWGTDRNLAIERMEKALANTTIHGIATNVPFLLNLLSHNDFRGNRISTKYIDTHLDQLLPPVPSESRFPLAAYLLWWIHARGHRGGQEGNDTWERIGYWRQQSEFRFMLNAMPHHIALLYHQGEEFLLRIDGALANARIMETGPHSVHLILDEMVHQAQVSEDGKGNAWVSVEGRLNTLHREDVLIEEDFFSGSGPGYGGDPGRICSPMPGKVVKVNVEEGEKVTRGQVILIVEAMKMENSILAPTDGTVDAINVKPGDKVDTSKPLVHLAMIEE